MKIYLDQDQSEYFGIPYDNRENFVVSGDAIIRSKERFFTGYDEAHMNYLEPRRAQTFDLRGVGYGWYEVVSVY